MTPLLTAKSLTFHSQNKTWYGKKQGKCFQLGPLDISIERAETVAIIGGNRSGKSLLAMLLCGAMEPSKGDIVFHRESQEHNRRDLIRWQKRQVRMIFQRGSESLNPALTNAET